MKYFSRNTTILYSIIAIIIGIHSGLAIEYHYSVYTQISEFITDYSIYLLLFFAGFLLTFTLVLIFLGWLDSRKK